MTSEGELSTFTTKFVYADASAYFGMNSMWARRSQRDHYAGRPDEDNLFSQEGTIVLVDNVMEPAKIYLSGMGKAIGHYARWLRPGAVRIDATSSDDLVQVTSFQDVTQGRLVLVFINNNPTAKTVDVSVRNALLRGNVEGEQSTADVHWKALAAAAPATSNAFVVTLPALSVTTVAALTGEPARPQGNATESGSAGSKAEGAPPGAGGTGATAGEGGAAAAKSDPPSTTGCNCTNDGAARSRQRIALDGHFSGKQFYSPPKKPNVNLLSPLEHLAF